MRAVVQKVITSNVEVEGEKISEINKGIMALIGICQDDTEEDMDKLVRKLINLKLFKDDQDRFWKKSVKDLDLEILCVSQFTLYAQTSKGNKPDFHLAMKTEEANAFYNKFLDKLRTTYKPEKIKDGKFGAMMNVSLVNEGPVTIIIDTK
ncbi:D-tyrosyl-tRNA deacylase [Neocallimastix lanati (nom. inval.)]|uniref:D-aminoacyl-tRNA deacylase n=1 Tax=Neocallimastix californiae TaxID=1754190 RepID=A0A1Y2BS35_9FUNG|nr:D-tyrosyl-tRNA deacylase [Neocallimastix sp. JGI-2020a]ORY37550.1 D-tyrosyl-tRNA deacylase [Neocallimastix californiae]|eukprot:ORY37550.1 D-tyrosyl-tRNA deacylase [Neocallimastix californiae]